MATTTIVLSSSPSRSPITVTPTHKTVAAMSSSPGLPSPSQLFAGMPSQISSGNRAAPIPNHDTVGFASASTLLRLARFESESGSNEYTKGSGFGGTLASGKYGEIPAGASKERTKAKKQKAPAVEVPEALLREKSQAVEGRTNGAELKWPAKDRSSKQTPASKKPRKKMLDNNAGQSKVMKDSLQDRVAKTGSDQPLDDLMTLERPKAKKPPKKKNRDESEGQTKIKKAKIIKPGSSKIVEKRKKTRVLTAETFNTSLGTQEEDAKAREEFQDLCIEKAIPIRRGWTPCKDTIKDHGALADIALPSEPMALRDTPITMEPPGARFGQLVGHFGFSQNVDAPAIRPEIANEESGEVVMKKRKIELVNGVSAPPLAEKQKRIKSPKKKPQTITEKATAPFGPADALAGSSLLQYFSPPEGHLDDQAIEDKTPVATKIRAPAKRAPKTKATNHPAAKKSKIPILLSPGSAMKNARDQELVFGTSSQLARDESPTFIKYLQQAIEESATVSQESEAAIVAAGKFRTSNALAVVRPRNLWAVASRDSDGSLLEAETVDLTETPKPPKTRTEIAPCLQVPDIVEYQPLQEDHPRSEPSRDIVVGKLNLDATPVLQQKIQEPNPAMPKTVAEATLRKRPSNRCPVKNATNMKSDPNQMPNYHGYTDAQLAKEVAAHGFKSIKKRVAMITLLEQCWGAKVSMALQEVQANLYPLQPVAISANVEVTAYSSPAKKRGRPPKSATASSAIADDPPPKKPRGRPKKDPAATTPLPKRKRKPKSPAKSLSEALVTAEDDIYDSSPPTPSPPRPSSKSPRQLPLSQPTRTSIKARVAGSGEDKEVLFAQMTKAITTFPPTNDVKNLTFHEKILMYEPVVLEDLTAWLNTQGLANVGEDDEVEPALVKEWCEGRSVCCLWRENLRVGARGRW